MRQQMKKWGLNIILTGAMAALVLAIGSLLPTWMKEVRGPYRSGDYSVHVAQLPYKLTLYETTTCPHCAKARDYLEQAGIPFNDQIVDQSKAAAAAFKQLGEKYVPVLVAEKKMVVGFDKKAYADWGQLLYAK